MKNNGYDVLCEVLPVSEGYLQGRRVVNQVLNNRLNPRQRKLYMSALSKYMAKGMKKSKARQKALRSMQNTIDRAEFASQMKKPAAAVATGFGLAGLSNKRTNSINRSSRVKAPGII